jgi:acyl-coenzyme A thioesterase PaaI-like protein
MGVKVVTLADDWQQVVLRLPLTAFSRNIGGSMFGGYQAAIADPIAPVACARQFPGYSVWTRALNLEFDLPGTSALELRFEFDEQIKSTIREDLARDGRSTPLFEYGLYRIDGVRCTRVQCRVAIRREDGG